MIKPKRSWTKIGAVIFVWVAAVLLLYWSLLLRESLREQYGEDPRQLAGFVRWLLGYVVIFVGLCLLGWLNYMGPFRWLAEWLYRAWLLVLMWGVFEALQWRTLHDMELVEENLLVAGLCLSFVAGFTLLLDRARAQRERVELLQQKTAAELNSLRAQLHPHFLFNALNTIYSEALQQGQEKLSRLIAELSGILRFTLHQAQQNEVSTADEIAFLQRYIHLQEARLPDNPQRRLDIHFDKDLQPASIAPLLLIPFVENAFQYGLHPTKACFIFIHLEVEHKTLFLKIENSVIQPQLHKGSGLGIANTRQRLERLYPQRHQLQIKDQKEVFSVSLSLSL